MDVLAQFKSTNKKRLFTILIGFLAVILVSFYSSDFQLQQWSQWLIFCALSISLVWVWGHGGIFSFAQVAFFGLGAYVYGIAGINISPITNETFTAVIIATVFTLFFSALLGYFLFYGKISDVFVAISTLAVSLVLNTLMTGTADPSFRIGDAYLGGFNGMAGVPPLILGIPLTDLNVMLFGRDFFLAIGVFAVLMAYITSLVRESSFGRIVGAIRENEQRAELLGVDVPKVKVLTFMFGAGLAGSAGAFFAAWGNFVDPSVFGLQMATLLMVWVFSGGRTSLVGAFVGVFGIQKISEEITTSGTTITPLVLGLILIAIIIVIPKGVIPTIHGFIRARTKKGAQEIEAPESRSRETLLEAVPESIFPDAGCRLQADNVHKHFGGVVAVNGISLDFANQGVYCLIGPNGAGKSTFFNLLVGIYRVTAGEIKLDAVDITERSSVWRTQNGMSIKPQVLSLFPELSIYENLWIAAYAKAGDPDLAEKLANDLLDWLGYGKAGYTIPVGNVAHGNQQWIDIAMALAQKPNILLLDEPVAGMGTEESARVAELARLLGQKITVLIVEHDMEFVRQLDANEVIVFHQGEVLNSGTLEEVQQDERVLQVYLGRG